MITINDNDLPITVAEKIIRGTKPYNPTPLMKTVVKAITGNEAIANEVDMFDSEEIKEIADYLMIYYNNHNESEDKE